MPTYVSEGSTFEPHPEGQFASVCCDVVEMRGVETQWGTKNKVRISWQTDAIRDDGKPEMVSAFFTLTLSEMSKLRPFLESWRGKKFTVQELKQFDLDQLLNAQAIIQVQHNESGGKVYANVTSIMRPMKGQPELIVRDYVMHRNRPETIAENIAAVAAAKSDTTFDDYPDLVDDEGY